MLSRTYYVSIDFGTSGCAFAIGSDSVKPKEIEVFSGWSQGRMGVQLKCPAILLADPQGKFVSFGDSALDDYKSLRSEAEKYYLFERFKMKLYDAPHEKMIEATNGRSLPVVDVFAMALKFIKDKAVEQICKREIIHPSNRKIHWIVTVPTIWTDAAKDVMRKAANKINLEKESMVFAYESEAAALFTQYDFLHDEEKFIQFCYLVVDCGGGTVDIAAQKITKLHGNIAVENLLPPHGSNCGGFAVNIQFEKLMNNILNISSENFKQLKINCAMQWTLLINRNFEECKVMLAVKTPMFVVLPSKICKEIKKIAGKSVKELIEDYGDKDIEWDEDQSIIILNCSAVEKLYEPVLDDICKLVESVLAKQECYEVKTILLAGGFAESAHLFKRIEESFGKDYEVCRGSAPTYSVVKGAILCGQQEKLIKPLLENMEGLLTSMVHQLEINPETLDTAQSVSQHATSQIDEFPQHISSMAIVKYLPPVMKHLPCIMSRKMKNTIGIAIYEEFRSGYHDINKTKIIDNELYSYDVFCTLVKANESVYADCPKRVHKFIPSSKEDTGCSIRIYASTKENVFYIDEEECQHKTTIEINDLPKYETNLCRDVEVHINFFDTELEIIVYSTIDSQNKTTVTVNYEFT